MHLQMLSLHTSRLLETILACGESVSEEYYIYKIPMAFLLVILAKIIKH